MTSPSPQQFSPAQAPAPAPRPRGGSPIGFVALTLFVAALGGLLALSGGWAAMEIDSPEIFPVLGTAAACVGGFSVLVAAIALGTRWGRRP